MKRVLRWCSLAVALVAFALPAAAQQKKPNILILLADDMGYSDVGAYGSEIRTPAIDALAATGVKFTNFHVAATCSPTRSMLITGADNHRVGYGNMGEIMADNQFGKPGYEGELNGSVPTVAARLKAIGYNTYYTGKWHLGKSSKTIPHAQGFTRSFALMESGADNWENKVYIPNYDRNHYYDGPKEAQPPKDFYSSTLWTDRMIEFIKADAKSGKPFFGFLSYQAVHYPHQAPAELTAKYVAIYEKGWDAIRKDRFERQKKLGLVPATMAYAPAPGMKPWDALPAEQKRDLAKRMAVYAAMAEVMDREIGRLVATLKETGQYENTVIVFLSDNGPDATPVEQVYADFYKKTYDLSHERRGQKGNFSSYGANWASVSATPFSNAKASASEGGIRVPMIVSYPKAGSKGVSTQAFGFVTDIVPTALDIAGVSKLPKELIGKSMLPVLQGKAQQVHGPDDVIVYELAGSRCVFKGQYKLVMNFPPYGDKQWRLYDYLADPAESRDLSTEKPEVAAGLRKAYDDYAKKNSFVEVPADYSTITQVVKNAKRKDVKQ